MPKRSYPVPEERVATSKGGSVTPKIDRCQALIVSKSIVTDLRNCVRDCHAAQIVARGKSIVADPYETLRTNNVSKLPAPLECIVPNVRDAVWNRVRTRARAREITRWSKFEYRKLYQRGLIFGLCSTIRG